MDAPAISASDVEPATDGVLGPRGLAAFLALHLLVWTVVATIAGISGAVHHDMTEAYDWGREFQLGYAKHPPVFAWIAGAWFSVLPRIDWAFYMLSALNAAGGLAGVWALAGRLLPRPQQNAALLLTALTPFFNILAVTFNANAILLLVWPWTVYGFVRSIQSLKPGDAVLFGVLAAAAMGAKYSSILLLGACLVAALLHPRARAYFASPAPYLAVAACLLILTPHLVWALGHRLTTVNYVFEKQALAHKAALIIAGASLLGSLALIGLAGAAYWAAAGKRAGGFLRQALDAAWSRQQRWLTVLALGPALLTVLAGLAINIKVSTNFLIPAFFFIPIAFVAQSGVAIGARQLSLLRRFVAGWFAVALIAAPVFAIGAFMRKTEQTSQPRRELALAATAAWHEAFNAPLRIAAGTEPYGLAMPFYSPDTPSLYDIAAPSATPWVTPERLNRDGLLVVCTEADAACLAAATTIAVAATVHRSIRLTHDFLGRHAKEFGFELIMTPPAAR